MWLHANGLRFHAAQRGSGMPLLFVGGSGWDLRVPPTPLDSALTDKFDVVLYDQRGGGQSDKPIGPYAMEHYAKDAAGLLTALGWDRAHIVGYSFGGMVAQELAIRYPDCVNRLVLAATSPGGPDHGSYPIEVFLDLPPHERARRSLEVSDTRYNRAFQREKPAEFEALIDKRILRQNAVMHNAEARAGYRNQLVARAAHNTLDRLHHITAPTLILCGATDGQASVSGQILMAQRIPNARRKTVPGGHNFIFEHPSGIQHIMAFLGAQD